MNTPEFPTSINRNSPKHDFPHHQHNNNNSVESYYQSQQQHYPPSPGSHPGGQHQSQQQDLTIDGIPNNFPHRRSRASRTFKNPPQPHMCIKEKTIDGKEVFINVLSWTRIANPDNPDAPIPLYGGMKVGKIPPGSPRAPPLVYAVMASPEVLKKAGRKCPDTPERMNLVDLMCEFVEAMNPTLHLSRKPEILKDRDLSGELKDVWSAVQACRDKGRVDSGPPENLVVYTEFGPETAPSYEQSQQHQQRHQQQPQHLHQQSHHQYMGDPYQLQHMQHQSPSHEHYNSKQQLQKHQQSAITNSTTANSNSIESNSEKQHVDAPDCADSSSSFGANKLQPHNEQLSSISSIDELTKETESLKLSPTGGNSSKSNGLTLPSGGSASPSGENTPATSPSTNESNPVPPTSQQISPTSPTAVVTAPTVSPTTPAAAPTPPTPQKESKNSSSHNFFPMFRSSKSSNSEKSSNTDKSSDKDKDATSESAPDTPVKTSSKKSGLNFFRRNKSESKKEQPSTPTKQQQQQQQQQQQPPQTTVDNNKLNLLVDESLLHHHHHHHHLVDGSNGTGEIIENTATIVAK